MNKKIAIAIGVVVAIVIVSVLYLFPSNNLSDVTIAITNTTSLNTTLNWTKGTDANNTTILVEGPPGITPAKVRIDNLRLGIKAEGILTICNNSHNATTFSVGYRYPDFVADEYAKPSADVPSWIHISDTLPLVPAHSYKNIDISILMPSYAEAPGDHWEFWIGVIDQSQTGMVQVELCQRWLVTMS